MSADDSGRSMRRPTERAAGGPVTWARDLSDAHHTTILDRVRREESPPPPGTPLEDYLRLVEDFLDRDPLFQKIEIEVNLGCNRRCTYCFLHSKRREDTVRSRSKIMERALYERLVAQLRDLDFAGVVCFHFYGEPLLNKRLPEFVRIAARELPKARSIVYTNGDFLDSRWYQRLVEAGIDTIYVTRHDNVIPDSLVPLLDRPEVIVDRRADMSFNNRGGYLGGAKDRVRDLPCIFFAESIVATIDGNILPCSCDFDESMVMGNVREHHLRDIYYSEAARRFRTDLLQGRRSRYDLCRNCDYYSGVLGIESAAERHRFIEQESPAPRPRRG